MSKTASKPATKRRTTTRTTTTTGQKRTSRGNKSSGNGQKSSGNGGWTEKVTKAIGGLFSSIDVEYASLRDLYIKELQDLYSVENQLIKALPKMVEAASSSGLREALENHLHETEVQSRRLEQIFQMLDMEPKQTKCKAMAGIISEGDEWLGEKGKPGVKDAGMIAIAQRVEHYEIAGYGCVRTYAQLLGDDRAAHLLQTTLDEEGAADKKLTELAKKINVQAEDDGERRTTTTRSRKEKSSS